jgi:hypothetical protein
MNRHHVSNSGPTALLVTHYRDQVAGPAAAQHSDQLRQQTGGNRLSPNIQIDVRLHWDACILQPQRYRHSTRLSQAT